MCESHVGIGNLEDHLSQKGWWWIDAHFHDVAKLAGLVESLARRLGTPVGARGRELVETIRPKTPEQAHPSSLSAKFGTEEFPLHIDTAHWVTPCRYLILGCANQGSSQSSTLLLDHRSLKIPDEIRQFAVNELFYVRSGRHSFYTTMLSPRREYLRFDPGCMEPTSKNGEKAVEFFAGKDTRGFADAMPWCTGRVLVIDNWRILHGRENASGNLDRTLLRAIVLA